MQVIDIDASESLVIRLALNFISQLDYVFRDGPKIDLVVDLIKKVHHAAHFLVNSFAPLIKRSLF